MDQYRRTDEMSKICFLIPDGVGIRNYLYSGVLSELRQEGIEVQIWHSLSEEVISLSEKISGYKPQSFSLSNYPEDVITQIIRESASYARLLHNVRKTHNETLMANWSFGNPGLGKKLVIKLAEWIGASTRSYESILSVESLLWKKLKSSKNYKYSQKKLQEIHPDILFCTHQRMPGASAAILAARELGIPTVTAIFSWDNLPKARLAMRTDYYLVWSDYMKEEMQFYYPEIPQERILVVGTPQFDFYHDATLVQSREEFAARFGLDPSKKWILFSGDDVKTSPYDHLYLRDIAESLQDQDDLQLIFRQVPVEGIKRYAQVMEAYPKIIHISPFWKKGNNWQQFFPYPEDVSHLVNLAFHCATVVNIGSTMALDFSFFDKPGLFLRYDHQAGQAWTVNDVYRFQHFKTMEGLDAVGWIDSKEKIKNQIRYAVDHPSQIAKDRRRWLDRVVQPSPDSTSSQRIASFFCKIISQARTQFS